MSKVSQAASMLHTPHILARKEHLADKQALTKRLKDREATASAHRPRYKFDFPVLQQGKTPDGRITLWSDSSLGAQGIQLCAQVLPLLQPMMQENDTLFGIKAPSGVNVLVVNLDGATDGSTGAYHYGCDFNSGGDLYADAALGNVKRTLGLIQAELSEAYMGTQGKFWGCGYSNGEALSRLLAEDVSGGPNGSLADYETGSAWDQAGRPNFLDSTEGTDQNPISIGCGMVYLYWLLSMGYTRTQIIQAGCPYGTLASNYTVLTGKNTAWADFETCTKALPSIQGDNPWTGATPPAPAPPGTLFTLSPGTYRAGTITIIVP